MISNLAISTLSSQALLNNDGFFSTQGFFHKANICMKDMVFHLFERRCYPSTLMMVMMCMHASFKLDK